MPSTIRDVSRVRLPENMRWGDDFDTCPHCGRMTPRPYANVCGKWVRFMPYPCDCEASAKFNEEPEPAVREMAVPEQFREAVETIDVSAICDTIRLGVGVWLHGGVGAGKTATAYAVARQMRSEGWRVEVTSIGAIKADLWDSASAIDNLANCGLLVLDDLGKEAMSASTAEVVFRVVNARYERKKPVLVTSNLTRGSVVKWLSKADPETGKAVGSRLTQMTQPIDMGNVDRRLAC